MSIKSQHTPSELFVEWQTEDRAMDSCIDELQAWMKEVNQLGIPHFGEAADRLTALRNRMIQHFEREDEIVKSLAIHFEESDPSLKALQEVASRDHQKILRRLDGLMQRLSQLEPPFESWVAAMQEIESFVNSLHRHEREESDSFSAMLSTNGSQMS